MASILTLCIKYKKVPEDWKLSKTMFIHKKENCSSLSDWRPISLCNTISKLFTGCVAKRLINWATSVSVLFPAQKGFMPYDGAFENNFAFNCKLQSVRRQGKFFCAPSIDLTKAFGSIPHSAISTALHKAGVGDAIEEVASDLLDEACTLVASGAGTARPVRIRRGVRQRDPLA